MDDLAKARIKRTAREATDLAETFYELGLTDVHKILAKVGEDIRHIAEHGPGDSEPNDESEPNEAQCRSSPE